MRCAFFIAAAWSLTGCLAGDRISITFEQERDRQEATLLEVLAISDVTRDGVELRCAALTGGERELADPDLVVAERVELELPLAAGSSPLMVQVPQDRYAFLAEATDRFGFSVARGCAEEEVTSRRPLDLTIALASQPALNGRLDVLGETSWLQIAGLSDTPGAPAIEVQAVDDRGVPLAGITLRTLVEVGEAIVDREVETDAQGRARLSPSVGVGETRILVHARGLASSPRAFTITGLGAPRYQDLSHRLLDEPLTLLAGDFYAAGDDTTDLLTVIWSPQGPDATGQIWTAHLGMLDRDNLSDFPGRAAHAVAGRFDADTRVDLAAAPANSFAVYIHPHGQEADDLVGAVEVSLAYWPLEIAQLLSARVNRDDYDDLLVRTHGSSGDRLLVLTARGAVAPDTLFDLTQALDLAAIGDAELVAGDYDGDGDDDLALLRFGSTTYLLPCGDATGQGDGGYLGAANSIEDPGALPALNNGEGVKHAAVADVDGDGYPDLLIVVNGTVEAIAPLLTIAHGGPALGAITATRRAEVDLAVSRVDHLAAGDLNGDKRVDLLAVTNSPPQRAVLIGGDGSGRFAAPLALGVGMSVIELALGDFNDDGVDDVGFLGQIYAGNDDPAALLDPYLLVKLSSLE